MFWRLLRESVIIQGTLALMFSAAIIYMYVSGKAVPQELVALVSLILGYFFGAKTQRAENDTAEHIENIVKYVRS